MQAEGQVSELVLFDGASAARIECPAGMIPQPGQYLLAHEGDPSIPLATVLFASMAFPGGFVAAPPLPSTWRPGTRLRMRGPLGHGFNMPVTARRVALVPFHYSSRILLSLLEPARKQVAAVVWIGDYVPEDLPLQVEAQPSRALPEVCRWADYVAFDLPREALPDLRAIYQADRTLLKAPAQLLVRTPMPCGALAACGVCTVDAGAAQLLACEDGPVFNFNQLMVR